MASRGATGHVKLGMGDTSPNGLMPTRLSPNFWQSDFRLESSRFLLITLGANGVQLSIPQIPPAIIHARRAYRQLTSFAFSSQTRDNKIIDGIHGRWYCVTPHELDLIIYCPVGLHKLIVNLFFLFPWLAIRWVLRREKREPNR